MPDWRDPRGGGIRVHIDRSRPLPDPDRYLHPPCFDADNNPVFFGSAILRDDVVQPCKVTLKLDELVCVVPHRLVERVHRGLFTILPFTDGMELVPTSHGRIPEGCRPVMGGVDERGRAVYHAVAWVRGQRVPGRTCEHLGAAAVLCGGREHYVYDAHEILCWRDDDDTERLPMVNDLPEQVVPDDSRPSQNGDAPTGEMEPGDRDLAGMDLRATISDLSTVSPYPSATDFDGTTPLYFGSAMLHGAMLPGKVVGMRTCQVLHDEAVVERTVGFSVLPFSADMELVSTSRGIIPQGRRPVQGNHDAQGRRLYHAMLYVVGRQFPGMCAEHMRGAQGILQGTKYTSETGYAILCWKEHARPDPAPSADVLQGFSFEDDPAGQRLRKPFNGDEELTTAMTESLRGQTRAPESPWFFASALHDGYITPGWAKVGQQPCRFVDGDDRVITCAGPYCILPFLHDRMMLVGARDGQIPAGKVPVEGGRDREGRMLYHAVGQVADGGRWPVMGMAAQHLGGAIFVCPFGGRHKLNGYELLCWKR